MEFKMPLIICLLIFSCFPCSFLNDDENLRQPIEYDVGLMLVQDISYRKRVLGLCAATALQPTVFTTYLFNFERKKLVWHSDQPCDSVAVNLNGNISILKSNMVYSLNEKGVWIILDSKIFARDFAYSHDSNTLYYLEPNGTVRKYENSIIVPRDGIATYIDASAKGEIFVVNSNNDFFTSKFGPGQADPWQFIRNGFKDFASCENSEVFLISSQNGFVYQYINKQFIIINDRFKFLSISCDTTSNEVYAVKENKELYKISLDESIVYDTEKIFLIDVTKRGKYFAGCGRINVDSIVNYVLRFNENLQASFVGTQPCTRVAISSDNLITAVIEGIPRSYNSKSWKTVAIQSQIKDLAYTHFSGSDALFFIDTTDPAGSQGGGFIKKYESGKESIRDGRSFFIDCGKKNELAVVNSQSILFHSYFDPPTGWYAYQASKFIDTIMCGNNTIIGITIDSLLTFNFNPDGNLVLKKTIKKAVKTASCGDTDADLYGIDANSSNLIKLDI